MNDAYQMTANEAVRWLAGAAIALGASACLASPDAISEDEEGAVDVVEEALGGYTLLAKFGHRPLDVGPTYSLTVWRYGGCDHIDVIATRTGTVLPVRAPSETACLNITAGTSQSGAFVADSTTHTIYRLSTAGGYAWTVLRDTGSDVVTQMLDSDVVLHWYAAPAMHGTGLPGPDVSYGSDEDLLGAQGPDHYTNDLEEDGTYTLWWVTWGPNAYSASRRVADSTTSFVPGFSFDANYLYWVENAANGGTSRIRRVVKTVLGEISTVKSSTTAKYYVPRSNGSFIYWLEEANDGAIKLRRKNLANGNMVAVPFNYGWDDDPARRMLLLSDGLYFTRYVGPQTGWYLYRTQL